MKDKNKRDGTSIFSVMAGVAAGAAAVFLSKKENRKNTAAALHKAEKQLKEVQKNPKRFAQKVESQGKILAHKVVKEVSMKTKKITAKAAVKKVIKKVKAKVVAATKSKKVVKKAAPKVKRVVAKVKKAVKAKAKPAAKKVAKKKSK